MGEIVTNKNGVEFDIDAIATDLNGKMDVDGNNSVCPTLLSRTANSYGGVVEIWSDGYCVQNGIATSTSSWGITTVTLSQNYINTNYIINLTSLLGASSYNDTSTCSNRGLSRATYTNKTTSSFGVQSQEDINWEAKGYIR